MAFTVITAARHSLVPAHRTGHLTTRQASLPLRTAQSLPPTGLLTLGFDPVRFQTRPPAVDGLTS